MSRTERTVLVPALPDPLSTLLTAALQGIGVRLVPLGTETTQAREFALQLAEKGICHTTAMLGGQLADFICKNQLPHPVVLALPNAAIGCCAGDVADVIEHFLMDVNLPPASVQSLSTLLKPSASLFSAPGTLARMVSAVCLGDLLWLLTTQARAIAQNPEEANTLCAHWANTLAAQLPSSPFRLTSAVKKLWTPMLEDFCRLPMKHSSTRYVGIAGETFLRLSPSLNLGLEQLLCELDITPVPSNITNDLLRKLYRYNGNKAISLAAKSAADSVQELHRDWQEAVQANGKFLAPPPQDASLTPFHATTEALDSVGVHELLYLRTQQCTSAEKPDFSRYRVFFPALRLSILTVCAGETHNQLAQKLRRVLD